MAECNHSEICDECRHRLISLICERDRYRLEAEQRWAMRAELEELLGYPGASTYEPDTFCEALEKMRGYIADAKKYRESQDA